MHKPTDELRANVKALKSFGHSHEEIAKYFKIDDETLVKYYKYELETAVTHANSEVANKLYQKATYGDDVKAQIFWLKTRGRWRTADSDAIIENQDAIKAELRELQRKLDEKNKKEF